MLRSMACLFGRCRKSGWAIVGKNYENDWSVCMRSDLEKLVNQTDRDRRAMDWLTGFKAGVRMAPIPKDGSQDVVTGYTEGRQSVLTRLCEWSMSKGLGPMDHSEGLNLLMKAR
jgi:hypothetical protein